MRAGSVLEKVVELPDEVVVDEDGEIVEVMGERVKNVTRLGSGEQYDVLLVETESGRNYVVEAGASAREQYVEVLTSFEPEPD